MPRRNRESHPVRALVITCVVSVLALGALTAAIALINSKGGPVLPVSEKCVALVGDASYDLTPEQSEYAALIAAISLKRGLPARAASIALATALQESGLRNLDYGDKAGPDSRGLFQQRPSQGWGTQAQVMNPVYATNAFYDRLVKVPDYQNLDITQAAQAVQISAFPFAYAKQEDTARAFASALTGNSQATLSCTLKAPSAPGDFNAVEDALHTDFGPLFGSRGAAKPNGDQTLNVEAQGAQAWAVAQWSVANAKKFSIESVNFGGLQWNRSDGTWQQAPSKENTVSLTLHGAQHSPS